MTGNTRKYSVTMPADLAEAARRRDSSGWLSAYVTAAVVRQLERDRLGDLLAEVARRQGSVTDAAVQAARDSLSLARSTVGTVGTVEAVAVNGGGFGALVGTLILDGSALALLADRDPRMMPWIALADREDARVVVSAASVPGLTGETDGDALAWLLSRLVVEPVTADLAHRASSALRAAGMKGREYGPPAIVCATALAAVQVPAVILTAAPDAFGALGRDVVTILGVHPDAAPAPAPGR